MIFTEMYGNGYKMCGMTTTMELLWMGVCGMKEIASIGFLVGVAGSAIKDSAVQLVASSVNLEVVLPTLDFAY
jgi:hypothetical protein